jgi:hypothetical protein
MVLKSPLTGGGAAPGAPRTRAAPPPFRYADLPRALPPRLDGNTSYVRDFGGPGGDPAGRIARAETQMTPTRSTAELANGTPAVTGHIPGYTGFQCATGHNPTAVAHSTRDLPRPAKEVCLFIWLLIGFCFNIQHHTDVLRAALRPDRCSLLLTV